MAIFIKDGLTLVPELMEDAILRSNIVPEPVTGRTEIARVLEAMEMLYASVVDIHRASGAGREMIFSQAQLLMGEKVAIHIIGIRDDNGWIADVTMMFEPDRLLALLARQLSAVLYPSSQGA